MELISLITATHNRKDMLRKQYENIIAQTWSNWEWYIDDDSDENDDFFCLLEDDRVHYFRSNGKTIGNRRNQLIEKSKGEIIAIIDDDDFYTKDYLKSMYEYLIGYEFVRLNGFFVYNKNENLFGYWDLTDKIGYCNEWGRNKISKKVYFSNDAPDTKYWDLGYSFGYMFRKNIFPKVYFSDFDRGDDTDFTILANQNKIKINGVQENRGIVLHILHGNNISWCYPKIQISTSMLKMTFPNFVI